MQIALLSCFEALMDGLTKASDNLSKLEPFGWGQVQYDALQQKLGAIRAAEQAVYAATATLDDRMDAAKTALAQLSPLLVAIGVGPPLPLNESSFLYSTSLSSSSSFDWKNPSGGVWVTNSSSFRVPNGCPGASSAGAPSAGGGSGPGKFALKAVKKTAAKAAPKAKTKKKGRR